MFLLTWLIFGLLAASISYLISPEKDFGGFLELTILAVLGSVLGGFLANLMFNTPIAGFNFPALVVAGAGSLTLIAIPKFLGQKI